MHQSDAELWPLDDDRVLALTLDTVAEEIEIGLYQDPQTAGWTAVMASLSDLAAVGAEPIGLLLSVTLPHDDQSSVQDRIASGVADACKAAGTFILGGDTNTGQNLSITCAAAGIAPSLTVTTRVGIAPGDLVYATGMFGAGAALAACKLIGHGSFAENDWRPRARLKEAAQLRGLASACMDSSDGLIATLDQLARVNDVSIRVTQPLDQLLAPRAKQMQLDTGLPAFAFLASQHGEFELVFTVPSERREAFETVAFELSFQPVMIGQAGSGKGLFIKNRFVDGARIRNLFLEYGQDVSAYVQQLCAAFRG